MLDWACYINILKKIHNNYASGFFPYFEGYQFCSAETAYRTCRICWIPLKPHEWLLPYALYILEKAFHLRPEGARLHIKTVAINLDVKSEINRSVIRDNCEMCWSCVYGDCYVAISTQVLGRAGKAATSSQSGADSDISTANQSSRTIWPPANLLRHQYFFATSFS